MGRVRVVVRWEGEREAEDDEAVAEEEGSVVEAVEAVTELEPGPGAKAVEGSGEPAGAAAEAATAEMPGGEVPAAAKVCATAKVPAAKVPATEVAPSGVANEAATAEVPAPMAHGHGARNAGG